MRLHEITTSPTNPLGANLHVGWTFRCPGCEAAGRSPYHAFHDAPRDGGPTWTFNGDRERPTFSPSLLSHVFGRTDPRKCHLFLRDGRIIYCADSFHTLKGQTVDLPEHDPA